MWILLFQCDKLKKHIEEVRAKLSDRDSQTAESLKQTTSELQQASLKLFEMAYKKVRDNSFPVTQRGFPRSLVNATHLRMSHSRFYEIDELDLENSGNWTKFPRSGELKTGRWWWNHLCSMHNETILMHYQLRPAQRYFHHHSTYTGVVLITFSILIDFRPQNRYFIILSDLYYGFLTWSIHLWHFESN